MEQFQNSLQLMEKASWKAVRHNDKTGQVPNLRWGHSCALIEDEVVFFGGYADSNYMNDVWTFNTITMEWNEVHTKGDIPSNRSNCSMHYDKENNRLIVFGGGGANKQRFNTINLLDWQTKEWIEIVPKSNEAAPWARTYHTSELFYPHLVVFGGEGITDLDDLWIFNFLTMSWTEVPVAAQAVRPCARRFHSSAKVGNQFFVISGCHSKYRCLCDTYSIDLGSYFETGKVEGLAWRQRKMNNNTFLTRWGHTSAVYEDKIYVFGGRFCNDLNDIQVLDPAKDQVAPLITSGEIPKARRRHSACFLGSSMLIFGGFNGQYFNDLHYIKINSPRKKMGVSWHVDQSSLRQLQKIPSLEWWSLFSSEGEELKVCKGVIAPRFKDEESVNNFILGINEQLPYAQLRNLITALSHGYGRIDPQLVYLYGITIHESKEEMLHETRKAISKDQRESIIGNKRSKAIQPVVLLEDHLFREFLDRCNAEPSYEDVTFHLKGEVFLRSNRALLALNSHYFKSLLSGRYSQDQQTISLPFADPVLLQIILHFLTSGFVVTSKGYGHEFWVILAEMAQYCGLSHLLLICQSQLVSRVTQLTCQDLLVIALEMNLSQLARACAEQIIRNMIAQQKEEGGEVFPQVKNEALSYQREQVLKEVYGLLRFDILQRKIDSEEREAKHSLKSIESAHESHQDYKQNNQIKN